MDELVSSDKELIDDFDPEVFTYYTNKMLQDAFSTTLSADTDEALSIAVSYDDTTIPNSDLTPGYYASINDGDDDLDWSEFKEGTKPIVITVSGSGYNSTEYKIYNSTT